MSALSPSPSSSDTITRVLFLSPTVHIYTVPPLTSTKGYTTPTWSPLLLPSSPSPSPPEPVTCRLRLIETSSSSSPSLPTSSSSSSSSLSRNRQPTSPSSDAHNISTTILLEDPSTGALFAACPYTSPSCVEPALDSARFFALRVQGDGGRRKAVLGIGFEERGEACEFVDVLRGCGRVMGWGGQQQDDASVDGGSGRRRGGKGGSGGGLGKDGKRDWSLKDGEMIRVEIGGRGGSVERSSEEEGGMDGEGALFSITPPPIGREGGGGMRFLPPSPSAKEVKDARRRSRGKVEPEKGSAAEFGFDDGEFGEFQ